MLCINNNPSIQTYADLHHLFNGYIAENQGILMYQDQIMPSLPYQPEVLYITTLS